MKPPHWIPPLPAASSVPDWAELTARRRAVLHGPPGAGACPAPPRIGVSSAAGAAVWDAEQRYRHRFEEVSKTAFSLSKISRQIGEARTGGVSWVMVILGSLGAIVAAAAVVALGAWLFTLGTGIDLSGAEG